MEAYRKSSEYNYYSRPDNKSISYSDGNDIEDKIFELVKNTTDKTTLSDELVSAIHDWPTEYHFSKSRHCLLRPIPFLPEESILELGCGCGAITRYLGETGADVDSVEGTHSRARIAGERCIDLDNVNIYVDNLLNFESEKKYDWVLFIGVLEYAPMFSCESEAIQHYLKEAKKFLKPTGKLVVAIENKLGLKYFNGCAEDHVNEPYFGIENRYNNNSPVTFGKEELTAELRKAGFSNTDYYYPFPDYKLPNLIINQTAFLNKSFNVGDLLRSVQSRDYAGRVYRAFNESLVWPELANNNLVESLSNSYLVIADNNTASEKEDVIAWYYNTARKKEYVTETKFKLSANEKSVEVSKRKIADIDICCNDIVLNDIDEKYFVGSSLQSLIEECWNKYQDYTKLTSYYQSWFEYILSYSNYERQSNINALTIPGHYIDLTPFNIKINNEIHQYFDQEWTIESNIPLLWLLYRGLFWSLQKVNTSHALTIDVNKLVVELLNSKQISVDVNDIDEVITKELWFISEVSGQVFEFDNKIEKFPSKFTNAVIERDSFLLQKNNLEIEVKALRAELESLRQSLAVRVLGKLNRVLRSGKA